MENFNILSAGGFMFFLLILVMGYFIVEILFGKYYFLKKTLKKNDNHVLDRFIHYVMWGIIGNILFFLLLYWTQSHIPFIEIFEKSKPLALQFNEIFGVVPLSYQIVSFSIFYLCFFIFFTSIIRFLTPYIIKQWAWNYKMFRQILRDKLKEQTKAKKKFSNQSSSSNNCK